MKRVQRLWYLGFCSVLLFNVLSAIAGWWQVYLVTISLAIGFIGLLAGRTGTRTGQAIRRLQAAGEADRKLLKSSAQVAWQNGELGKEIIRLENQLHSFNAGYRIERSRNDHLYSELNEAYRGIEQLLLRVEAAERRLLGLIERDRVIRDKYESGWSKDSDRVHDRLMRIERSSDENVTSFHNAVGRVLNEVVGIRHEVVARVDSELKEWTLKDASSRASMMEYCRAGLTELLRKVDRVFEAVDEQRYAEGLVRSEVEDTLKMFANEVPLRIEREVEVLGAELNRYLETTSVRASERVDEIFERRVASLKGDLEDFGGEMERLLAASRDRLCGRVEKIAREETRQVEALLQLLPQVAPRAPMPASGRWAMDARSLLHLAEVVRRTEPKLIVELGGGTSTIWLGYLCESLGSRLISFDHDERFLRATAESVERHGLQAVVECRLAPLEILEASDGSSLWYRLAEFKDLQAIDLLVVDGPPKTTGSNARQPALPLLQDSLSDECVVVLDDSEREDEKWTIEDWLARFPAFRRVEEMVSGLGVLSRG